MLGDDDGLVAGDGLQGATVEVVEVGVGDEDEIDGGEVVKLEAGVLDALDDLEPLGPVWVDEDAVLGGLDKEGGVADPGDADFVIGDLGEVGFLEPLAVALGEERWDDDLGQEVALVPSGTELHVDMKVRFRRFLSGEQSANHG